MTVNAIGVISMFYARPFTREHFDCFQRMKRAGADVVELLVPEPGELDLKETRAAIADAGLACVLAARVNLTRDLASGDADAHKAGVAYLESCVDSAAALGATVVGGPLYGAPLVFAGRAPAPVDESERKRRIDAIVAGLAQAGRRATDAGILFGVEPLNRFETDICNTTRHALEIVERVDSPAAGVMLDTFHMNMEEFDLADAIRLAGSRLVHFQANENNRGFVGSGHIDWPAIARALRDVAYRGPIVLEPFRRNDERAGTPLAQWRVPTENEDEPLAASIAFLKTALAFAGRTA
ncbi:MAG TPA: sugar phosphate isomerase/epimerase family protein [Bosea sp. (in: a-proteobacteria)]|jgi:D-psicose/D-tagatose/L-ribulose 3-epimerase|uniref:sugar phosphate isomerase/epimerase family protein n=1 Tax=Bosea sp. (in: a-proteobacteria) TaxID=1871050 RepID=UPI002E15F150|nr:sugar phosphate isomerase/epimerase family protein [Bosea sp. (in: a-proteobacteria)]